jgi:hypothetical protein
MSKEEIEKELREPDLEDGRRLELKSELANKVAQENAQKVVAQQASVTERTVRDQFVERTRKAVAAREEKEAAVREQRDAVKIALQEVNRWYSPSPPELAREAERAMKERADRDPPSRGGPGFSR